MADWRPNLNSRDRESPIIMGIVNVTPDSFYPNSRFVDPVRAVEKAVEMVSNGAMWVDVGGESTRPGARELSEDEEIARLVPVIGGIRNKMPDALISVDKVTLL